MIQVGDVVVIRAVPPAVEQMEPDEEFDTRQVFRDCLHRPFRVRGINEFGFAELWVYGRDDRHPEAYRESIWVEPDYVEVVRQGGRRRR